MKFFLERVKLFQTCERFLQYIKTYKEVRNVMLMTVLH